VQFESILEESSSDDEESCEHNPPILKSNANQEQATGCSFTTQIGNLTDKEEAGIFGNYYLHSALIM